MPSATNKGGSRASVCSVKLGSTHWGCGIQFNKPWKYPRGGQNGDRCRRICRDIRQLIRRKMAAQAEKERSKHPAPEYHRLPPTSLSDTHIQSHRVKRVPTRSASFSGRSLPAIRRSILRHSPKAGHTRHVAFLSTTDDEKEIDADGSTSTDGHVDLLADDECENADVPTTSTGAGQIDKRPEGTLKRLKKSMKIRKKPKRQENEVSGSTEQEGETSSACTLM